MHDKIPPCLHFTPSDHVEKPSCLDSAYERKAIEDGWEFNREHLFPENKVVYDLRHKRKVSS